MRRGRSPTTIRPPTPSVESPGSRANTLELHELEGEEPGNVIISVRVRPETGMAEEREEEEDISTDDWQVESKTSTISYQGREGGEYIYDNVFAHLDQNSRVYNSSAKRLVRRVMEGM
jgi:centromeric protein E